MKEKFETIGVEVEEIEVVDLGDALEETRQGSPVAYFPDGCCSYTWTAE